MASIATATDVAREMLIVALTLSFPILAVGLVVGLAVGVLQAVTQVHEQTVSFIPKIFAMAATVLLLLPWLLSVMTEYAREIFSQLSFMR